MTDRGAHLRRSAGASSGRRLFVGLPLPPDAAAEVVEVVEAVRSQGLPAGARDVRWVRLDGLHLTVRFLGPTADERIPTTMRAVETAARAADGPIDIALSGSGTFPSGRRPRALWIGLTHGAPALADLARATEDALAGAGWPREDRPFRAHLTLARSDGVGVGPLVAERLAAAMTRRRIECRLDTLGLFESITGGGPARYVALDLHRLGATPSAGEPVYHQDP